MFDFMIHKGQKPAHRRGQRDLWQFALSPQALVEGPQCRVGTDRTEGRHVQGQAHLGAAAADTAHALHRAAFSGPRSQTGQGGHLLAIQLSQFGHMSQHPPGSAGANTLDLIQAFHALLQRGIFLQQGVDLLFDRLDLGLEVAHKLGVLSPDEGILMMFSLGFGQSLSVDQLLEPLSECDQLILAIGCRWRRLGLITLAIISQHLRINAIGFCPLAAGLSRSSHWSGIGDRDRDLTLVQGIDHGPFIATGGLANDVNIRGLLQLMAHLAQALRRVAELALSALQMNLKGRFGNIHSGINSGVLGLPTFDRVLTHPYRYELAVITAALATVRAWSTGRARLWLGYGLAEGHPRVARARARQRRPFAQKGRPHFLACATKTKSQMKRSNSARIEVERSGGLGAAPFRRNFFVCCSTPARYARLRGTAHEEATPGRSGIKAGGNQNKKSHPVEHIRVARHQPSAVIVRQTYRTAGL